MSQEKYVVVEYFYDARDRLQRGPNRTIPISKEQAEKKKGELQKEQPDKEFYVERA